MSVPRVIYIAAASEAARIQFMESWLNKTGCVYSRIDGVELRNSLAVPCYDREKRLSRFGFDMTLSEIGCFLAHRKSWELVGESSQPALILESDCYLNHGIDLSALLRELSAYLEPREMVRLHGIFERNEVFRRRVHTLEQGFELVQCLGDPRGTAAYFITPTVARQLYSASERFFEPVDVFLGKTWFHRVSFRTVKPYPFSVEEFPSVIGERRRPKQSIKERLTIELCRAGDDCKRILYMPWHFWG